MKVGYNVYLVVILGGGTLGHHHSQWAMLKGHALWVFQAC